MAAEVRDGVTRGGQLGLLRELSFQPMGLVSSSSHTTSDDFMLDNEHYLSSPMHVVIPLRQEIVLGHEQGGGEQEVHELVVPAHQFRP